jgi:hypothetical protein
MKWANFFLFWMLVTLSLSRGDVFGFVLTMIGFLVMHTIIEEHYETN